MKEWRGPRWNQHFFESGIVVGAHAEDPQANYVKKSYNINCESGEAAVGKLEEGKGIKSYYPSSADTADFPEVIACSSSSDSPYASPVLNGLTFAGALRRQEPSRRLGRFSGRGRHRRRPRPLARRHLCHRRS